MNSKKIYGVFIFLLVVALGIIAFLYIERKILYPLKYKEEVLYYSNEFSLSPYLVFATIKVESSFSPTAKSSKGASGLMQITDKTARYIAVMLGEDSFDLFDPETNIRYGCRYLRYLLDKFNDDVAAICAYNAGEGNVLTWLKNNEYSTDGKTLSVIPFSETNSYLKKIYQSLEKYRKLYENILDKPK